MRVGPYELLRPLSSGSSGQVFLARAPQGVEVALKLLTGRVGEEGLLRFERERRLLAQLGEAEGFVPLIDAGVSERGPFLVMPFVDGGTLRDRLRAGPLSPGAAVSLLRTVAAALGRAHALGIVHRDVKPENILFTRDGRPLVADLGLARHFRHDVTGASQSAAISQAGGLRGTVAYMAPEQLSDPANVGAQADVFALSAVLFECLTGRPTLEAETLVEALEQVGRREVELSLLPRDAPPALAGVLARGLAREPARRHASGAALAAALGAVHVVASRRSRAPVLAGVVLVAGALVSLVVLLAPPERETAGAAAPLASSIAAPETRSIDDLAEAATLALEASEPRRALDSLDRLVALRPEWSEAWRLRGVAWRMSGDPRRALPDYERALALDPRNVQALMGRGLCHADLGDERGAIEAYDAALRIEPEDWTVRINRALAWHRQGQHEPACADAAAALAGNPRDLQVLVNVAIIRRAARDLRGAHEAWSRAFELEPTASRALERGHLRFLLEDLAGAERDAGWVLARTSKSAEAWNLRASCRVRWGDSRGAIADCERGLALAPPAPLACTLHNTRGTARRQLGDLPGALEDATRAIELSPAPAAHLFANRGNALEDLGQIERALADFERALALDPEFRCRYDRGEMRQRLGDQRGALEDYEAVLAREPGNVDALINRGVALRALGETSRAMADYDRALTLDPRNPRAWRNRGNLKQQLNDRAGALADQLRAVELDQSADAIIGLGCARRELGDLEGALADFERGLALDPDDLVGLVNCGLLRRDAGDKAGALADLSRARALVKDGSETAALIEGYIASVRAR